MIHTQRFTIQGSMIHAEIIQASLNYAEKIMQMKK